MNMVLLTHCLMFNVMIESCFSLYLYDPWKVSSPSQPCIRANWEKGHSFSKIHSGCRTFGNNFEIPCFWWNTAVPVIQFSCKKKHRFLYCFWNMYYYLRIFERSLSKATIFSQWLKLYIGKIRRSVGFSTRSWSYIWEVYTHWVSQVKWNCTTTAKLFFSTVLLAIWFRKLRQQQWLWWSSKFFVRERVGIK